MSRMSDDLISRKEIIETVNKHTRDDGVIPHFIYIQIMLYSVELKAA